MPIRQAYNSKTKSWVKYKFDKGGFKVLDVKENNPTKPFTGVPIKGARR
jgi:hypothetical protein